MLFLSIYVSVWKQFYSSFFKQRYVFIKNTMWWNYFSIPLQFLFWILSKAIFSKFDAHTDVYFSILEFCKRNIDNGSRKLFITPDENVTSNSLSGKWMSFASNCRHKLIFERQISFLPCLPDEDTSSHLRQYLFQNYLPNSRHKLHIHSMISFLHIMDIENVKWEELWSNGKGF